MTKLVGPVWVTLAYVLVYYSFQFNQLFTKSRLAREYKKRGEKFDRYFGNDRQMLAADRYVGNTLEHMGPFLVLLWLQAIYVSPLSATMGGALYVLSRAVYPFLIGRELGRGVPARVLFTTVVGYLVLTYFAVRLAIVAATS